MFIMNVVWPITALYFGPLAVWGYFRSGMKTTAAHMQQMRQEVRAELAQEQMAGAEGWAGRQQSGAPQTGPTREQTAVAVSHCGAGCTLGDTERSAGSEREPHGFRAIACLNS